MVKIPRKSLPLNGHFKLSMKVQEVSNYDFENKRAFVGPILHISSSPNVEFKKPATIRIPIALQQNQVECEQLKRMFIKLTYPLNLINSTIATFVYFVVQLCGEISETDRETQKPVRITLPFKDQKSADAVRKQLKDLGKKIGTELQPVYKRREVALVKNQWVVHSFKCDRCDADYVRYTTRHLHNHIEEHKASVIGKHMH
ncbi:hypothetical protein ACROYT_G025777 [Oculina patagonica]